MGALKRSILDEQIRQEEHAWDAIEGLDSCEKCLHTPDKLNFVGMEHSSAGIILHFKCNCGQEIKTEADLRTVTETIPVL